MEKEIGTAKSKRRNMAVTIDRIGFTVSSLCAVHCALMPFVITFLPLIGWGFLAEPWLEISIILLSIGVGVGSLVPSYRKHHRSKKPIFLLVVGFIFIFGSHLLGLHEFEPILMPIGGGSIAAAHYLNWKLSRLYHGHSAVTHES